MKKRLFVVSDIHGHATLFEGALKAVGFDPDNEEHLLIVLGDNFDRGTENKRVMEDLKGIKNKILIRGNHEDMLENALERYYLEFVDYHNGTDVTVRELFGSKGLDKYGNIYTDRFVESNLLAFMGQMRDYFETEHYVFVHGWIPVFDKEGLLRNDWRLSGKRVWRKARFTEWMSSYREGLVLPDKTIVCGHRSTAYGCRFDNGRRGNDYSPFYGDGMIAIDACTVLSGQVNILVLEDEVDPSTL